MRNILVELVCRNCCYHTHIKSHTLIQPALEPALRFKILQGNLFTYECPRCHEKITFIHNCLYHDVPHHFMIYMSQEARDLSELQEQFPTFTLRHVSTPEELKETIRILEDGLNDRCIMHIKEVLMRQDPKVKQILYHDQDEESETIWLNFIYDEEEVLKAITKEGYEKFLRNIHEETR